MSEVCAACKRAGFSECHGPHISDDTIKGLTMTTPDPVAAVRMDDARHSAATWCGKHLIAWSKATVDALLAYVDDAVAQAVAERDAERVDKSPYGQHLVARHGEIKTAAEHAVADARAQVAKQAEEIAHVRELLADCQKDFWGAAKIADQRAEEIAGLRAALEQERERCARIVQPQLTHVCSWSEYNADLGYFCLGCHLNKLAAALRAPAPAEPEDRPNANGMFEPGLP